MKTLNQILETKIEEMLTLLNCESNENVTTLYMEEVEKVYDLANEYSLQDAINNGFEKDILESCLTIIDDNEY